MKRIILMLLCAVILAAQEKESVTVVPLKHVSADSVTSALNIVANGRARFAIDPRLRVVTITGQEIMVEALEKLVKSLDVPAPDTKNVEATFYMILAGPDGESGTIPSDLTGVAQQLRSVFGLKSVRVLETAVIRAREGKGMFTQGVMAAPARVETKASYSIDTKVVSVSGSTVRLDGLRFSARLPYGTQNMYSDASINTDIDIREGQRVVVGKSSVDTGAQSIFLVVMAKVVD